MKILLACCKGTAIANRHHVEQKLIPALVGTTVGLDSFRQHSTHPDSEQNLCKHKAAHGRCSKQAAGRLCFACFACSACTWWGCHIISQVFLTLQGCFQARLAFTGASLLLWRQRSSLILVVPGACTSKVMLGCVVGHMQPAKMLRQS